MAGCMCDDDDVGACKEGQEKEKGEGGRRDGEEWGKGEGIERRIWCFQGEDGVYYSTRAYCWRANWGTAALSTGVAWIICRMESEEGEGARDSRFTRHAHAVKPNNEREAEKHSARARETER